MIRVLKFLFLSYVAFQIFSYSFIWTIAKYNFIEPYSYLYFNESWFPEDEPTSIYCSENILKIRPDRVLFYFSLGGIFQRPGAMPIYFGVRNKSENYWWSFKEWQFVSAQKNGGPYIMLFDECAFEGK
jgi:hypothetical protein